jgi:hypothetical protein
VTLSFNLILGLFLLAPGLAVFAALYHGSRLGPVESPPPPPGSILALSIVTVGALIAHLQTMVKIDIAAIERAAVG